MFENENSLFGGESLDLGNDVGADFDSFMPFPSEEAMDIFGDTPSPVKEEKNTNAETEKPTVANENTVTEEKNQNTEVEKKSDESVIGSANENAKATDAGFPSSEPQSQTSLFEQAIAEAESKETESAKSILTGKLPIFSYGSAKEDIVDTSKTFEALRVEKADDFPELDDASVVSWKVTYGSIVKVVSTSKKKTTIASFKKEIEDSNEFTTMLTKSLDKKGTKKEEKPIECIVTPTVTAKKKGVLTSYKGVAVSLCDAKASGKLISFVPSDDGKVYEVRSNKIGTFVAEAGKVKSLDKVRAGFSPALPKIPYKTLSEIIAFFKSYVTENTELEALAYIYWSFEEERYYVYIPKQKVSKARVDAGLPDIDEDKFLLVMEVHSHNTMLAMFSSTDDKDERATRLYTVIGRINKIFPDITTRISVGGKYVEIEPELVFKGFEGSFPASWHDAIKVNSRNDKGVEI